MVAISYIKITGDNELVFKSLQESLLKDTGISFNNTQVLNYIINDYFKNINIKVNKGDK